MANWRIKSLDSILATAEKKPLSRTLGAFQTRQPALAAADPQGTFQLWTIGGHLYFGLTPHFRAFAIIRNSSIILEVHFLEMFDPYLV